MSLRKKSFSKKMKKRALHRANHRCEICGCHVSMTTCEAHHVKPVSQGGQNSAVNLQIVCRPCHLNIHQRIDSRSAARIELSEGGKTLKIRKIKNNQSDLVIDNIKNTFIGSAKFLEELDKISKLTKDAVNNLSNSLKG